MARNKPEEQSQTLNFYKIGEIHEPFAPWRRNEKGRQVYIKLSKGDDESFLYVGSHFNLQAEVQQGLMRLVNDGWTVEGEMVVHFDGRAEPGTDPYVYRDPLTIELGRALLPIADPQHGSPLMAKLETVREEIAREMGLVTPPVRVLDNLGLDSNQYLVRIKDAPAAMGEVYLDRLLVLGSHEQLGELEGWATTEPVHRMRAKWIEPEQRDKAEQAGCLVLGPLTILMTHIKSIILGASGELLGLQETFELVGRLQSTHSVVVEDFLHDRRNLRALRKVLKNLLQERVSIRDLVTILETAGDMLDQLDRVDLVTEFCRMALSRQICNAYLDNEGVLRGLALSPESEKLFLEAIQTSDRGPVLALSRELADDFLVAVRQAREEHGNPPVLFTDPPSRLFVQRVLARALSEFGVLATTEIPRGLKVEVCGQIDFPRKKTRTRSKKKEDGNSSEEGAAEREPARREGMFGFLKGS
ncbi:MAG: FHIPEP family type III secretion protein [Armatimonadetes bacterium]|nr:FHIPEP family type III secretion protein [Armatimonadota bacterium]